MHASILFLLSITALATARSAGTYGWTSIGCYVDSGNRLLGPVWVNDNNNNVGDCLCWCGNIINNGTVIQMSECSMPCPGDSTQKCGGQWRQRRTGDWEKPGQAV
ncbi:hypothetical protein P167DRAFT_543075 [Morchella conica CCBAS932]|uniref:WSC domain-containing protein n=1 Tax=Morchella conica CCBAS932 TaxID=1392247 RepID=A0A3N4KX29_9PEZI|nr:hypothetical protein P167DRAFT_543075 [Morchella conica CCBAS932]